MDQRQHPEQALRQLGSGGPSPMRQVPLDEIADVIARPGWEAGGHEGHGRQPSPEPELTKRNGGCFGAEQRSELEERHPSRERFGYFLEESGCHGPEEQEATIAGSIGIDGTSQPTEQGGPGLSLVEGDEFGGGHDFVPLGVQSGLVGGLFEIEVVRGEGSREGGLAGLARAEKGGSGLDGEPLK